MKFIRFLLFSLLLCFVFPVLSNADQLEDAKAAIENKEFKKAYKLLTPLAEANNAEAQTLLGALFCNGEGVEKDPTKGLSWIMKAATQGYEAARAHALSMCMDLAKQGDASAMYNVGYMCLNGWGGEQETNDCIEWLETAAKLGHTRSAKVLSSIYEKGSFGVTADKEKSSYWSNMAEARIDGIWSGSYTPGGMGGMGGMGGQPMTITYKFKSEGDSLTGEVSGGPGQWLEIKDGKIDGNNISFKVDVEFNKMNMTFNYAGVLMGDDLQLAFTVNMGGGGGFGGPGFQAPPTKFVAKRVK